MNSKNLVRNFNVNINSRICYFYMDIATLWNVIELYPRGRLSGDIKAHWHCQIHGLGQREQMEGRPVSS